MTALGHSFETIADGLTILKNGEAAPAPLVATRIAVEIRNGLATIRTSRTFRNVEACSIEAVLTMPIGFDAVVTGLRAVVDGRQLTATAKPKETARAAYEDAIDKGKMAMLHEEALRGVHVLSVAQLAPGKEVLVELDSVVALTQLRDVPFLRIPVTVGQLYGTSPFAPADDLVTSAVVAHIASLTVTTDTGAALLGEGRWIESDESCEITLDAAVELRVPGARFGAHLGVAADGRQVRIDLTPVRAGDETLDLAVLVDHSGSTGSTAPGHRGLTVWQAMRDGLHAEFAGLRRADRIALWQFDTSCELLGKAAGDQAAPLTDLLAGPAGGTELGAAISKALASGVADILVLTDGQTWARTVDAMRGSKARISAILVGSGSLDANIGQLCAQTGGQLFYAAGDDVAAPLARAFAALRQTGGAVEGLCTDGAPSALTARRGGVEITATWSEAMEMTGADAVGRYAAALALPLLATVDADAWAVAHTLCTHRTSLILIDEAGESVDALPEMRKVALTSARVEARSSSPRFGRSMFAAMAPNDSGNSIRMSQGLFSGSISESANRVTPSHRAKADHLKKETPALSAALQLAFQGLAWDVAGEAFLAGDFSRLDTGQRLLIAKLRKSMELDAFALIKGLHPTLVALALIANITEDRLALRFTRRVFQSMPESDWAELKLPGAGKDTRGRI